MAELNKEKEKINKGKTDELYNTQTMLNFSEIRGNTIVMKDGGLRAIIKIFGLNLDLRNYDEQQIVIEQYKRFLNGLEFPVQIIVRSTYLDLTDYINYISNRVSQIENEVLKRQGQQYSKFLNDINSRQGLIYTKEFYIVVPYYQDGDETTNVSRPWWRKLMDMLDSKETPEKIMQRYRNFTQNRKNLDTRCNMVEEGLKSFGVFCERLGASDIISLLFRVYNPNAHKEQVEKPH
ncbi:hypothetical protein [Candidatus Absconditicoccus praedator]|uniref:hypothetical protein n=1 Tax=Candidatus Absconditicoccus praedator TaxID=2735562 RepID=UPI001E2CB7D3|nr:hypothetical protein [Candidatus Absconditicoccus praedator]UFX83063.1 hypothetical protein HLG78_02915 [Candidatus Absconditicoccus praedator]